jgi:hypothetical protein
MGEGTRGGGGRKRDEGRVDDLGRDIVFDDDWEIPKHGQGEPPINAKTSDE